MDGKRHGGAIQAVALGHATMAAMPSRATRPTPNMLAVLEHLAEVGDRALIRLYSQWWIRESDGSGSLMRGTRDPLDRVQQTGSWLVDEPPMLVVPTATVKAMAARGLLKLTGPKRRVLAGSTARDHWRAELTAAGTSVRAEFENLADSTYRGLLKRLNA